MKPTLHLIRGLPGSGKSTLASRLVPPERIFESDRFMVNEDGVYAFDPSRLPETHAKCHEAAEQCLLAGYDCVVSNTSLRLRDINVYRDLAQSTGAFFQVISVTGDPAWQNTHGVPRETLDRMKITWQTTGAI